MTVKEPGLKITVYRRHLKELINICRTTRLSHVQTYWHLGRCISETEKNPQIPSGYGSRMLHLFSKDLVQQFGKGYSVTNLKNMRTFYQTYNFDKLSPQIDWSSYTLLLSVKDPETRNHFEKRIINEALTHRQLKKEIFSWRVQQSMEENKSISPYQLKYNRGTLYAYTLVNNPLLPAFKDRVTIDCGFNIHKTVVLNN